MQDLEADRILYVDPYLIAVDKPSGVQVHAGQGGTRDERPLMNMVRDYIGEWVYPIHRLDRPVSGVVLFLRRPELVKVLQEKWAGPEVEKVYWALARRHLKAPGSFAFPLSGQEALTTYVPLEKVDFATLVEIRIHTGRTHQIRRHFGRALYNIVGDSAHGKGDVNRLYRNSYGLERIFLHCMRLCIPHPVDGSRLEFKAPLPLHLEKVLERARIGSQAQLS